MQGELIMCKFRSSMGFGPLLRFCAGFAMVFPSDSVEDGERITHPSELKDVEWHNWTSVYGYPMLGTPCGSVCAWF